MAAPGLVIFDCDGVLIDSEVLFAKVLHESLVAADFPVTADEALALGFGRNNVTLAAAVIERFGRPLPDGFFPAMRAQASALFERELTPIEGVVELLGALPTPRCVASNSHIDRVRHSLSVARLLDYFEPHVFSASMVAAGKPAPDLFLLAASRLGVAAARCLVVEDSAAGVVAARAAGMPVVGFCGGSHCSRGHADQLRAAGCRAVFARMSELAAYLGVERGAPSLAR